MKGRLWHVFPTFGPGGSQARTCRLIEAAGPDWEHRVFSLDGDLRSSERLAGSGWARSEPAHADLGGRLAAPRFARWFRSGAPDLVATYNWGAMDAVLGARLAGVPVIHHEDGFNSDEMNGQKLRRVWARRVLLRSVHAVVVPSLTLHEIARRSWKVPAPILTPILNGIDVERFHPGTAREVRERLGVGPRALLVGTVGRLDEGKNLAMLLRAVGTANNRAPTDLVILGDGPERTRLQAMARSLHIAERVHFAGHVCDPAPWFRAMDVFAMSSRSEQMPVSILEAMASALPVVATDVGDTRAMLAADNRRLVAPLEDSGAYVEALMELLTCGPLRYALGSANRSRVCEQYDERVMVAAHERLWERTLGESSPDLRRAA